jgi:hypothetical protein
MGMRAIAVTGWLVIVGDLLLWQGCRTGSTRGAPGAEPAG